MEVDGPETAQGRGWTQAELRHAKRAGTRYTLEDAKSMLDVDIEIAGS